MFFSAHNTQQFVAVSIRSLREGNVFQSRLSVDRGGP